MAPLPGEQPRLRRARRRRAGAAPAVALGGLTIAVALAVAGPVTLAALSEHLDADPDTLPEGLGGVPVTALVRELVGAGHDVVVATLSRDVDRLVTFTGPRLRVHVGPYRLRGRARDAFRTERAAVRAAIRAERPDVVHAHWSYEFALGALASGAPTLVTLHDWAPTILRHDRDLYRTVRLGMHAATVARSHHLTAVSPYIAAAAARWRRPATVVPNGLEDRWFDDRPRSLRVDAPRLISVNAGFAARKNTTTLLLAHARVRRRHPQAQLCLVGAEHEEGGPAHRWARERGVTDGVDFRGALPHADTIAALAAADVLVHPSWTESFGMTLIEAMAQGTPVVAGAASGGVPWVLDGGAAGALTDVTSEVALADAIDGVLRSPDRWAELSGRGYERAATTFRLSRVADRYLERYDAVRRGER